MGVPKYLTQCKNLLAHNNKKNFRFVLVGSIFFSWVLVSLSIYPVITGKDRTGQSIGQQILGAKTIAAQALISPVVEITIAPSPTPTITPTNTPTPVPTKEPEHVKVVRKTVVTPTPNTNPAQYTAERINDVTWRVKDVANDDAMASAQDIVNAINSYRGSHGLPNLSVDPYLSTYAQERANKFASNGSLDSHADFQSFMDNGGFDKAGFNSLGENSAYVSGPMNGEKIVKNIFGADPSHDGNQLDNWTHVGVGVNGNAVNVNFGKGKK